MDLALKKNVYEIKVDGQKIPVASDKDIDWQKHIKNKDVIKIDGSIINCAYISIVKVSDINDGTIDTALAWAKSQQGPIRVVAIRRVQRYEDSQQHKMPIEKIIRRVNDFQNNMSDPAYSEYLSIYLESGGKQ